MTDAIDPSSARPDGPHADSSRLAGLADELMRLARTDPDGLADRIAELTVREQAELALRLPAPQRLALLLHSPTPLKLVRALPNSELYLTVREVGPAEALPLLKLASGQQLRHLIDLEAWRKDQLDADRTGAWVATILESGEPALRRLLQNTDDEVLALLLARWARISQLEYEDRPEVHGHGQGDAGTAEGLLTPDGEHRFLPTIPEHAPAIRRLLVLLFEENPERYSRLLWASRWELPSELEEQALHWRNDRLEQHGFPSHEEALRVFEPPDGSSREPMVGGPIDADAISAARSPLRVECAKSGLVPALDRLNDRLRERVLIECIALANRLLIADHADTGDPEAHSAAMERAIGYMEIGLKIHGGSEPTSMARLLEQRSVLEWFREGYAEAAALQRSAHRLLSRSWPQGTLEALLLLDSPVRERVAALLEPRPLYFDPDADDGTGLAGMRDFRNLAEFEESRVAIEVGELFGRILVNSLGLDLDTAMRAARTDTRGPFFSTFLLTAMAWNATRGELSGAPLPDDVVAEFLRTVASRRTADPEAGARAFRDLNAALTRRATLTARETAVLDAFGRYCLQQLTDECGQLDPGVPPDPRAISCLLLESSLR